MKFIVMCIVFGLSFATISTASAACGPPKCPMPAPRPPLSPAPNPQPPTQTKVIGYFEVASPECSLEAYAHAVAGAEQKAVLQAQQRLGTADVVALREFWHSTRCGQSIYAGSFKGNSWIVQAFGEFGIEP